MINPLKKTEMPESQNSLMRAGAALALGDIPEGPRGPHLDKIVTALCYRLIDERRPKYVHDPDQEVRAGAVEALKNYADKRALVVEALIASLADPFQKTRCLAVEALKTATGQDDMGFKCDGTLQVIQDGQRKWQGWWAGQKASWKP